MVNEELNSDAMELLQNDAMQDTAMEESSQESMQETVQEFDDQESDDDIRPTDIVFDCPSCGHNLAIDYRGAGLQINCVECGAPATVPIPEGMKINDLDLSAGELLTQLFQTRRMLQKSDQRIIELEESLTSVKLRRTELEKSRMATLHRCAELVNMCQSGLKAQNELSTIFNRMMTLIAEEQQR